MAMKIDGTLPRVHCCSEEGLRHLGVKSTEAGRIDGGFPHHAGSTSVISERKKARKTQRKRLNFIKNAYCLEKSNLLLSLCKIYGQTRRKPATQSYGALRASQLSTADSRHSPWFHSSALTLPKVLMRMMLRQAPKNRIGQDRASGVRCFTLSAEYKAKALSGMGRTMS